jgi:ABC-type molybdate transport system substrate-binding protein
VALTSSAASTLAAVDAGHVDAAVAYATDVALAREARLAFRVPEAEQPRITYVAALTRRGDPSQPARALLAWLLGPGLEALRAAGFGPPPPRLASGASGE